MNKQLLLEVEKGTKSALIKKKIINYYIHNGGSTITELSKEIDMSIPTVTKFIMEMCEEGFIDDYGKLETAGGRHPNLYGLNPDSGYFVGVDIKQSGINIGMINFKGDMLDMKMGLPYSFQNTPESMNHLCEIILDFIDKQSIDKSKILNIDVNISGRVNPESGYSYSVFFFEERPLTDILHEKLGYPVSIDNDTRAMTYGEYMSGSVTNEKNIIFVNISWGLAMHRRLIEMVNDGATSSLSAKIKNGEAITLDDIIDAVLKEDVLCISLVEEIGQKLGENIAGLINIFNPEMVIVGGTVSVVEDYIMEPIKTAVRKYSLNLVSKDSVITVSKLKDKAGVVGACMLSRSRVFEN